MSELKLRGCPFCGSEAGMWETMHGWSVTCEECSAFHGGRTTETAITAWNTRPREAELEAEVGRLRALLEPFAEAARLGIAGGYPPFHFVAADDYDRARIALSHHKGADDER